MSDAIYCTDADVYDFGVPRGGYANPARLVQSIASASDELTLRDHGYSAGDAVTVRADAGGALPSPLVAGVTYYVIVRGPDRFALSASVGGAAIDFAAGGSNVLICSELPIERARWAASREIEELVPAHAVPFVEPYPRMIVLATAELAAARLGYYRRPGVVDAGTLRDLLQRALDRFSRNIPVRVAPGQIGVSRAVSAVAVSAAPADTLGWRRFGGL